MLFDFDLIVPPATSILSPAEMRVQLTRGTIKRIRVFFPPGPASLVHVVVRHNLHQLIPANYDATLNYDDILVDTSASYDLIDPPYELRLLGWSPEAIYEHKISISFDLEPLQNDNWDSFNRQLFDLNTANRLARGIDRMEQITDES